MIPKTAKSPGSRTSVVKVASVVEIVDYNPHWPEQFERLKVQLLAALDKLATRVEHVGSTSVPGLAAKPIIDIDIVIRSSTELPATIQCLTGIGYEHQGDLGITGRHAFKLERNDPMRHVYVCAQDSIPLREHLMFRDYLRQHPSIPIAYAALKRRLAETCGEDRNAYTAGKTAFIRNVLNQVSQ